MQKKNRNQIMVRESQHFTHNVYLRTLLKKKKSWPHPEFFNCKEMMTQEMQFLKSSKY